jgi:hypothetical protein
MWHGIISRCVIQEACKRKRVPFLSEPQFQSLLKQGEDEVIVTLVNLAKRVQ